MGSREPLAIRRDLISESDIAKFSAMVGEPDQSGCRRWMGGNNGKGYGKLAWGGSLVYAHRFAYVVGKGDIGVAPNGRPLLVCHSCDNPWCVEVSHLWVGTNADNMRDCSLKGRSSSTTRPERLARGDRHGSRLHPESQATGERNGSAKLTESDIPEILALHAHGMSQWGISRQFGISPKQVRNILSGKNWSRVVVQSRATLVAEMAAALGGSVTWADAQEGGE